LYRHLQRRLLEHIREFLRRKYQLDLENIVVEQPPRPEMGEYALPLSFELARRLRRPPRKIAEEIVAELPPLAGFGGFAVAGGGYINARIDRAEAVRQIAAAQEEVVPPRHPGKILVEHTSINPNKAAHIGHLRNAILGDTFVRLLRAAGRQVDVQNYIDNTGVQVADVVVGFVRLEGKSKAEIAALIASEERFDYYCWDLYAGVSQWYGQDKANLQARLDTLHAIERGGNELAEIAELISAAVLRRHLETMERLGIEYDFLPRESEILRLHFWELAFEQLKQKKVLYFEAEGKNQGCWVMTRPAPVQKTTAAAAPATAKAAKSAGHQPATQAPATQAARKEEEIEEQAGPDEDAKVIVRSNGTVGYVGKDIAYHLWKFGLLGRDFGYRKFFRYPNQHDVWISTTPADATPASAGDPASERGEADHPHFGGVAEIYNVIDARQSEPQNTVIEALRLLGYTDQAEHYTHFSYEMVALTPRCALELGYQVSQEDRQRAYIEVSGRKGFGVKADDLIDKLIAAASSEVDSRHPELSEAERQAIGTQIALGALRYFMLKFTKQAVIAFDFRDALAFEGETGPYAQYAVVRARNIFRKGNTSAEEALAASANLDFAPYFEGETGTEIWQLWLLAGQLSQVIDQAIATTEPAYLAKYAFQLAQQFNNFYHRHHILTEPDPGRKRFLLATAAVVQRGLIRALEVMGIGAPEVM
jgi:arginyl-tRNA synthetase